jgi:hypothetical protein
MSICKCVLIDRGEKIRQEKAILSQLGGASHEIQSWERWNWIETEQQQPQQALNYMNSWRIYEGSQSLQTNTILPEFRPQGISFLHWFPQPPYPQQHEYSPSTQVQNQRMDEDTGQTLNGLFFELKKEHPRMSRKYSSMDRPMPATNTNSGCLSTNMPKSSLPNRCHSNPETPCSSWVGDLNEVIEQLER